MAVRPALRDGFRDYQFLTAMCLRDTGTEIAPTLRLELGASQVRYSELSFRPAGTGLEYRYEPIDELVFGARVFAAMEYRFWERFVVSAGLSVRQNFNALAVREVGVPVAFGWIW
jgi:hypothetical protein